MANELNYYGQLNETGLTVYARVYDSSGTQVGSDITCTETGTLAIYVGDMPTATVGQYGIRFFNSANDSLLGQGSIDWDGTKEIQFNIGDILEDTNELQTNQGNFATATGFATPTNITDAQTAIITEIDANETKIDTLTTNVAAIPTTDSVADLTPVLTAMSNLNDITTAQIRTELATELARLDVAVSSVVYDDTALTSLVNALPTLVEMEASTLLTAVADITGLSTHSAADVVTAMQAVANDFKADLTALNDFDPATDQVIVATNNDKSDYELANGAITSNKIANNAFNNSAFTTGYYNDINSEVDMALIDYDAPTKTELDTAEANIIAAMPTPDEMTEAELHAGLDSYTNKDNWKADVSTLETKVQADIRQLALIDEHDETLAAVSAISFDDTAILNAINALNDLSLSDIEGSMVLAKETTLSNIVSSIASIPTTDSVADLTPVLAAISNLNDVTAAEVRAVFNAADFQDKNVEAEIHAWLDTYANKDDWKGDAADLTNVATIADVNSARDAVLTEVNTNETLINSIITTLSNLNDPSDIEIRDALIAVATSFQADLSTLNDPSLTDIVNGVSNDINVQDLKNHITAMNFAS